MSQRLGFFVRSPIMRQRLGFFAYLAAVVAATLIHEPLALGVGLALCLLLAGRQAWPILRRSVLTVLAFNLMISLSYAGLAWYQGRPCGDYLLLLNLRVLLITTLSFLVMTRLDLFRALAFSRTLTYLLTLAYSQTLIFQRLYHEMRQALASRSITRLSLRDLYRHGAASSSFFVEKALSNATETAQAMRSRGFFDDPAR